MNNFDLASTLTQSRARAAAKLCPAWHPQRLYALITTIKPPSCVLYEGSEIKVPQAHKRKPEPRCSTGSVASCKRCNEWPSVPLCKKKRNWNYNGSCCCSSRSAPGDSCCQQRYRSQPVAFCNLFCKQQHVDTCGTVVTLLNNFL